MPSTNKLFMYIRCFLRMTILKIVPIDFNHPLIESKFKAIFRFLKWQLKSRLSRREHIHFWIENSKFYVRNGETGLTQNIYVGLHEFHEMGFLLHLLKPKDCFVDIGANVGSYSILAGVVNQAKVYAIEPIEETYKRLEKNLILNNLQDSCTTVLAAMGSEVGTLRMTTQYDTMNRVADSQHSNFVKDVDSLTLDKLCVEFVPTLIKIDVEGWEFEVLKGGVQILRNPTLKALIVETKGYGSRYGFKDSDLFDLLLNFDFKPCSYNPLTRELKQIDLNNSQFSNTIFVRDFPATIQRLHSAPFREILGYRI